MSYGGSLLTGPTSYSKITDKNNTDQQHEHYEYNLTAKYKKNRLDT